MAKTGKLITAVGWVVGVGGLCAFLLFSWPAVFAFLDRINTERQRLILYQIDHSSLGILLRDFATRQRWSATEPPKEEVFLHGDAPSLPPALQLLKPSSVRLNDERIDLEFGGALLHFGISAYRPGVAGAGTRQLAEGLWFYSENGRFPSKP